MSIIKNIEHSLIHQSILLYIHSSICPSVQLYYNVTQGTPVSPMHFCYFTTASNHTISLLTTAAWLTALITMDEQFLLKMPWVFIHWVRWWQTLRGCLCFYQRLLFSACCAANNASIMVYGTMQVSCYHAVECHISYWDWVNDVTGPILFP